MWRWFMKKMVKLEFDWYSIIFSKQKLVAILMQRVIDTTEIGFHLERTGSFYILGQKKWWFIYPSNVFIRFFWRAPKKLWELEIQMETSFRVKNCRKVNLNQIKWKLSTQQYKCPTQNIMFIGNLEKRFAETKRTLIYISTVSGCS